MFGGFDSLLKVHTVKKNHVALNEGLQNFGICKPAAAHIMENPKNFMFPNIFNFIKKMLPPKQMEYAKLFSTMHINTDPSSDILMRLQKILTDRPYLLGLLKKECPPNNITIPVLIEVLDVYKDSG
jgi:hypothetical protein